MASKQSISLSATNSVRQLYYKLLYGVKWQCKAPKRGVLCLMKYVYMRQNRPS